MNAEQNARAERDARLGAVLAEWREAVAGVPTPDEQAFLQRYPEFADELRVYFADGKTFPRLAGSVAPTNEPRVLDDFELLREIGRGGMGVVYEARQRSLGRRVALKVLPLAATMDPRSLQRFKHEAQAAAHLDHPHIVHVYAVGCAEEVHYYAMQMIEGESLAVLLKQLCQQQGAGSPPRDAPTITAAGQPPAPDALTQTLPEPATVGGSTAAVPSRQGATRADYFQTVAGWAIQAAEALEYAHQMGVVHRDVKPSNLLLDRGGQLWVADFGLARFGRDGGLTRTGEVVGTLRYMSPEQALARHGLVDHRADVYALGATLYELLTLRPAVEEGDYAAMLRQVAYEEPRPLRQHDRTIPRDLETITLKAMAKEPERRYAAAREMADDLRRFLEHQPIRARPPTLIERGTKWSRRHRPIVWSGMAVLLMAVVALSISTLLINGAYESETSHRQNAEAAAERERRMAEETREKQRHTATLLAGHQLNEGLKRLGVGNAAGLLDLLDARETADDLPELRDPIGRFWAVAHHQREGQLAHALPEGYNVAFSPDGRRVAILGDGAVHLIDTMTGQPCLTPLRVSQDTGAIVFSPDSRLLATHSTKHGGQLWEMATGKPVGEPMRHDPTSHAPHGVPYQIRNAAAFSPDGKWLATGGIDGTVRVWEVPTGRPRWAPLPHGHEVWSIAFSPDGKWLASGSIGGTGRLWNMATGQLHGADLQQGGFVHQILFTPDSKRAINIATTGVTVWETETGRLSKRIVTNMWILEAALSPDGKVLAAAMPNWKVELRDVETGQVVGAPLQHGGRPGGIRFSPDGKWLAVLALDGMTTLWQLGRRAPVGVLVIGTGATIMAQNVAWSPDSRFLATTGHGRLWRVEEPPLRTVPLPVADNAVLSPDGKLLAQHNGTSVFLRDVASGRQLAVFQPDASVTALAFSLDGQWLATGSASWRVQVWNLAGKVVKRVIVLDRPYGLAWSPDGTRIAAATPLSGSITQLDFATGKAIGPPLQHGDWVRAVSYSPDGSMIASVGGDGSASVVRLWSTRLGPKSLPLVLSAKLPGGSAASAAHLTFSRDGRLLFVKVEKGDGILFRLPPPPSDLGEIRLRTWVALGARRDSNGLVQPIPVAEWTRLRDEVAALDRQRQPIPWEALESAFADELQRQAQKANEVLRMPLEKAGK